MPPQSIWISAPLIPTDRALHKGGRQGHDSQIGSIAPKVSSNSIMHSYTSVDMENIVEIPCGFCAEFTGHASAEFQLRYGDRLNSRQIYNDGTFCAFPTIAQLQVGHLLLAPIAHFENFASAVKIHANEFLDAYKTVRDKVAQRGHVFTFEHGAREATGGGCGIYHAHIHLVPLSVALSVQELNVFVERSHQNLIDALRSLEERNEYILTQDSMGVISTLAGTSFGSQFMRKRLIERLGLDSPNDWRLADQHEPAMLAAVNLMGR